MSMRSFPLSGSGPGPVGAIVAIGVLALMTSCGGKQAASPASSSASSPGTGSISFAVEWEAPPSSPASATGKVHSVQPMAPAIDVCTDYGIDTVTMKVLSGDNVLASAGYTCTQHGGTLNNIPAGNNLVLRLEASVPGAGAVWAGDTAFNLSADETKNVGKVVMSYTGTDNTAPTILSVTPDNNATHIQDNAVIRIGFSERMAINTVQDNASITVVDNLARPVPGIIVYSVTDNSATFTPSSLLPQGLKCTVTVGTAVTDMAGNRVPGASNWSFSIHAPGTWGDPVLLENMDFGADLQHVAMDNEGRATVLWVQNQAATGYLYDLWSNRYIPGTGWEGPVLLENASGTIGPASADYGPAAQIAVQDDGKAAATWWQHTEPPYMDFRGSIFASRYSPVTGWEDPSLLENGTDPATIPRIVMSDGNISIVWIQQESLTNYLWAKFYSNYTGWQSERKLATVPGAFGVSLKLVPGLVAWAQDNGVWAIANPEESTAGMPVIVSTGTGPFDGMQLAGNGASAIAVWMQNSTVMANQFLSGQGWGTPVTLSGVLSIGGSPVIGMDAGGNAITVWGDGSLWARRYVSGQGWETATNLGDGIDGNIAMNRGGTAIVFVGQNNRTVSRHYVPGQGWGEPRMLPEGVSFSNHQAAIDGSGNAIIVGGDDAGNVWASRYY